MPVAKTSLRDSIAALFIASDDAGVAEAPLSQLRPDLAADNTEVAAPPALNLAGQPKLLMTFGPGRSGKTTLLRWIGERSLERGEDDLTLCTMDTARAALKLFFPAGSVIAPGSDTGAQAWLERLFSRLMASPRSVAIDFGADQTLVQTLRQIPLLDGLAEAGIAPVALYTLTPRSLDLTVLDQTVAAGFAPPATVLILNQATAAESQDPVVEFAQIRRHSTYRAAIDRGAVEIWMPRHYAAKPLEDRFMGLQTAATAEGGLSFMDRTRAAAWLRHMEEQFAPIIAAGWLP